MADQSTFENRHFERTLNTINAKYFAESFPLHWHKYVELVFCLETANNEELPILQLGSETYTLYPGDILFFWPGELHGTMRNHSRALAGIQFFPTLITDIPDFAPYVNLFRSFHHISATQTPELCQNMYVHAEHVIAAIESETTFCNAEAVIHVYEMLMELGGYINRTLLNENSRTPLISDKSLEKIKQACDYINENCTSELSLETVANFTSFSPCYFSRLFKQTTNHSFVEYLALSRIKKAQALLCDSSLPITEISFQSGFKSISTFNRVFRQYRGCTPREYRMYYSDKDWPL